MRALTFADVVCVLPLKMQKFKLVSHSLLINDQSYLLAGPHVNQIRDGVAPWSDLETTLWLGTANGIVSCAVNKAIISCKMYLKNTVLNRNL